MQQIRTRDLDEAVEAVKQVYCPHRLQLEPQARAIDTLLSVGGSHNWPIVRLAYGAPVQVDAGDFENLFLVMRSLAGEGTVRQSSRSCKWHGSQTIPVSAYCGTDFAFSRDFSQVSIRLDARRLELLCSRWIGHPLDNGLRFALTPFSPNLERTWSWVLGLADSLTSRLPEAAVASLEEFILSLLLKEHPHNFSSEIDAPQRSPSARVVQRADIYLREHLDDHTINVSDVAAALGVSIRLLQAAFRECKQTTPGAYIRNLRLEQVYQAFRQADRAASVTDIAMEHGFFHLGRFAHHYKQRYGEAPAVALTRARRRLR